MTVVRPVESFVVHSVKDHEVAQEIEGLPFSSEHLEELLENCPSIVTLPSSDEHLDYLFADSLVDDPETPRLHQPSPMHQRSFQLIGEQYEKEWTDEFGNSYTALTLKGNNFSNPHLIDSPTASNGFIPYGLQESEVIGRVLAASQALRERNISTEYVIGLAEPKQLPWPLIDSNTDLAEYVTVGEYKNRMVEKYWNGLNEKQRSDRSFIEIYQKFQEMVFYVSLRASDSVYRLADLNEPNVRQKVFDSINENLPLEQQLDGVSRGDKHRYINEYVLPNLAQNFAALHTDLAHRFPHAGNVTINGGIVDLDSVHGEGLGMGDEPITDKDRVYDITYLMEEIVTTVNGNSFFIRDDHEIFDSVVTFVTTYLDHVCALAGSPEEAAKRTDGFISELVASLEAKRAIPMRSWTKVVERITEQQLQKINPEVDLGANYIDSILERIERDPELRKAAIDYTRKELSYYSTLLVGENINEINDAHWSGGSFEITKEMMEISEMLRIWGDELYEYFEEQLPVDYSRDGGGHEEIDALASPEMREAAYRALFSRYENRINSACRALTRDLMSELEAEIVSSTQFELPAQLFGDTTSHRIETGFNTGRFWYFGEGVKWSEVEGYLHSEPSITLSFETPRTERDGKSVCVESSDDERIITEIVSGSIADGWGSSAKDGKAGSSVLKIEYDEVPDYILVIEQDATGRKYARFIGDKLPEQDEFDEDVNPTLEDQEPPVGAQLNLF